MEEFDVGDACRTGMPVVDPSGGFEFGDLLAEDDVLGLRIGGLQDPCRQQDKQRFFHKRVLVCPIKDNTF